LGGACGKTQSIMRVTVTIRSGIRQIVAIRQIGDHKENLKNCCKSIKFSKKDIKLISREKYIFIVLYFYNITKIIVILQILEDKKYFYIRFF